MRGGVAISRGRLAVPPNWVPPQTVRLRFIPCRVVRNDHPRLSAPSPEMQRGHQPGRVIQRPGFDVAVRIRGAARHVIQPCPALRAEPALHRFHRTGPPREHPGHAFGNPKTLPRNDRRHRESGAGLPLTLRAMTRVNDPGRAADLITNRAALTSAGLWKTHGSISPPSPGAPRAAPEGNPGPPPSLPARPCTLAWRKSGVLTPPRCRMLRTPYSLILSLQCMTRLDNDFIGRSQVSSQMRAL